MTTTTHKGNGTATRRAPRGQSTTAIGETSTAYFRRIFAEQPEFIQLRTNDEILSRWLADHPGEENIPKNVKTTLANLKSVLRKQAGGAKKPRRKGIAKDAAMPSGKMLHLPANRRALDALEEQLDGCLSLARAHLSGEHTDIIAHVHEARNLVVRRAVT